MSGIGTGLGIPKWQMALLLGAPLAFGVGYLIMRKPSVNLDDSKSDTSDPNARKKINSTASKSVSLDGEDTANTTQTLSEFEQALNFKVDGNKCFRNGKFKDAIDFYDQAIQKCPADQNQELATFYQNRAAAYEQLKKWKSVIADCTKALELNPAYLKAMSRRAKAYESSDDLKSSLEDITACCILEQFQNEASLTQADRVLKTLGKRNASKAMVNRKAIYPSHDIIKAYFASFLEDPIWTRLDGENDNHGFTRAKVAFEVKQYEECISACSEEIDQLKGGQPTTERALLAMLLRGSLKFMVGNVDHASLDFTQVIIDRQTMPKIKANAYVRRAMVHAHLNSATKALDDINNAEQADPENIDALQQRAIIYAQLDKIDEAISEIDRVLSIKPDLVTAKVQKEYFQYRLAISTENAVKIYSSLQALQKLNENHPDDVECSNLLAQILTEQQQFDKALPILQNMIKGDKKNGASFVHLGLLYLQWNGDMDRCTELIKTAIEFDSKCGLAYETLGTIQVQRGQLSAAIEMFEKALELGRTENELIHLFSLRDAAIAQLNVSQRLNLDLTQLVNMPYMGEGMA